VPIAEFRGVHVIPSGEVRMTPPLPATTYCLPDHTTACRTSFIEEFEKRDVHVIPSGEVRMVP
jgi:hypothetical protein